MPRCCSSSAVGFCFDFFCFFGFPTDGAEALEESTASRSASSSGYSIVASSPSSFSSGGRARTAARAKLGGEGKTGQWQLCFRQVFLRIALFIFSFFLSTILIILLFLKFVECSGKVRLLRLWLRFLRMLKFDRFFYFMFVSSN